MSLNRGRSGICLGLSPEKRPRKSWLIILILKKVYFLRSSRCHTQKHTDGKFIFFLLLFFFFLNRFPFFLNCRKRGRRGCQTSKEQKNFSTPTIQGISSFIYNFDSNNLSLPHSIADARNKRGCQLISRKKDISFACTQITNKKHSYPRENNARLSRMLFLKQDSFCTSVSVFQKNYKTESFRWAFIGLITAFLRRYENRINKYSTGYSSGKLALVNTKIFESKELYKFKHI